MSSAHIPLLTSDLLILPSVFLHSASFLLPFPRNPHYRSAPLAKAHHKRPTSALQAPYKRATWELLRCYYGILQRFLQRLF